MKKCILCLAALLLLGCRRPQADRAPEPAGKQAEATAVPAVSVTVAPATERPPVDRGSDPADERILGHCLSIAAELPHEVDLDGDGSLETVDLIPWTGGDEYPRWAVTVTGNGQQKRFETEVPCDTTWNLWVGDLDEDGAYEIFFHGDMASYDYVIYGFRSDLTPLLFEPDERAVRWGGDQVKNVFDGSIEGFEDGHIVIEGAVDMLGTHWGVRNYALGDDGIVGPVSTVWTFNDEIEAERALTVQRELTAYKAGVRKDPGEAFTLKSGERICLLAGDGCERIWFETEKGKNGVLLLTPDEENMWLIDGVPEAEYFAFLPYSG